MSDIHLNKQNSIINTNDMSPLESKLNTNLMKSHRLNFKLTEVLDLREEMKGKKIFDYQIPI